MPTDTMKRVLNITEVVAGYSGTNANGNAFTIYDIQALDEQGNVVQAQLRSFDDLPLGQMEYDLEKYKKNGKVSWTIKAPKGMRTGVSLADHNALAQRVTVLEGVVNGNGITPGVAATSGFAQASAPAAADPLSQTTTPAADDDIPF